jgi:hypothetical protein
MGARREALIAIMDEAKPMTVRQVSDQATVRGIVEGAFPNPPTARRTADEAARRRATSPITNIQRRETA